ncbi:MAG TPA: type II toxin-antitoxin system HicB family antitoxin [Desulfomonilia bacterium]
MKTYIAVIHRDKDSDFGVSFPDFPGCITAGSTIDEAKDMAIEALDMHIKGMIEDGEVIPDASKLEDIMKDYSDALSFIVVPVSKPESKSVRINITIPENILHDIDAYAKSHGLSRSSFLAKSAYEVLKAA